MEKGWLVLKCFWLPEKNLRSQETSVSHTDSCAHTSMMHKSALMLTPHHTHSPMGLDCTSPWALKWLTVQEGGKLVNKYSQQSVSNQQEGENRAWGGSEEGELGSALCVAWETGVWRLWAVKEVWDFITWTRGAEAGGRYLPAEGKCVQKHRAPNQHGRVRTPWIVPPSELDHRREAER